MDKDLQAVAAGDGVSVHRGFPNAALESRAKQQALALDLNRLLVRRPSSTYLFRVSGHTWADQGIFEGDVAVVDRAAQAGPNDLLVAWRGTDTTIVRQHRLTPEDKPWGVITSVIHLYRSWE